MNLSQSILSFFIWACRSIIVYWYTTYRILAIFYIALSDCARAACALIITSAVNILGPNLWSYTDNDGSYIFTIVLINNTIRTSELFYIRVWIFLILKKWKKERYDDSKFFLFLSFRILQFRFLITMTIEKKNTNDFLQQPLE